jgi:hypothetical protein
MDKPAVVIDKCLLQPICARQDEARLRCFRFLMEHFTICVPPMLIEQTAANYFSPQPGITKDPVANEHLEI